MAKWIVRGLVFAVGMVVVRLFQAALINAFQEMAALISVGLMLMFIIVVVVWGIIDGRADAREYPDPDRRADLAMTWLLAGLLAGLVSGALTWLLSLLYRGLYVGALINEITTFAAFTALVVFLPGMGAVVLGRYLIDRKASDTDGRGSDEDRADTDVFDAVRDDSGDQQAGGAQGWDRGRAEAHAGRREEEQTSSVATDEAQRPTQAGATARPEEKTQPVRTDERTETMRTDDHTQAAPTASASTSDAENTRPTRTSAEDQR